MPAPFLAQNCTRTNTDCSVCKLPMNIQQRIVDLRFSVAKQFYSLKAIEVAVAGILAQAGQEEKLTGRQIHKHLAEHVDINLGIQYKMLANLKPAAELSVMEKDSVGPFVRACLAERIDFYERLRKQLNGLEEVLIGSLQRLRALGLARKTLVGDTLPGPLRKAKALLEGNAEAVPSCPSAGEEPDIQDLSAMHLVDEQSKLLYRELSIYQKAIKEYRDTIESLLTIEHPKRVLRDLTERILRQLIQRVSQQFAWEMGSFVTKLSKELTLPEKDLTRISFFGAVERVKVLFENGNGVEAMQLLGEQLALLHKDLLTYQEDIERHKKEKDGILSTLARETALEYSQKVIAELDRTMRQVEQVLEETDTRFVIPD